MFMMAVVLELQQALLLCYNHDGAAGQLHHLLRRLFFLYTAKTGLTTWA
jgi:hypothetical protein